MDVSFLHTPSCMLIIIVFMVMARLVTDSLADRSHSFDMSQGVSRKP